MLIFAECKSCGQKISGVKRSLRPLDIEYHNAFDGTHINRACPFCGRQFRVYENGVYYTVPDVCLCGTKFLLPAETVKEKYQADES